METEAMTARSPYPKKRHPKARSAAKSRGEVPAGSESPLVVLEGGLRYELDRLPPRSARPVVIAVTRPGAARFVDRVDLCSARSRETCAARVATTFGVKDGDVLGHLNVLLDQVERARDRERDRARPQEPLVLSPARRRAAEKLLRSPDLLGRAAEAMTARGHVGEEETKRLVYLVAVSRLLARPLSVILRAESASGKSELLERVTELLPEESVKFLSRLTRAALYYAGEDALRHKVVIVDEQAGATEADYSVRTLQSRGVLSLDLPVKGQTESFVVHGPIALLSGTTSADLNPENLSRCLVLALDETEEQTRRVQDAQRRAWARHPASRARVDLLPWQDAQRLLEPLEVAIPFAEKLTFPSRATTDRRDNQKLLTLVAAHALLYQRQRERDQDGCVVATRDDYAAIHALVRPVVETAQDGLSTRAARLYQGLVTGELTTKKGEPLGERAFTRREVARALGCPYMTATRALEKELVPHELVAREPGPQKPARYRVLDRTVLGPMALGAATTLTPPEAIPS